MSHDYYETYISSSNCSLEVNSTNERPSIFDFSNAYLQIDAWILERLSRSKIQADEEGPGLS